MEIFELAAELGKKLKEDARLVALENAKREYEADPDLRSYITEYEVQQRALQDEMCKAERDSALIEKIQGRTDELYKLIAEHPVFMHLNGVQAEVNDLMNQVNNTIMTQITGEEPSSCTHDCSTCGGCH